MAPKVAKKPAAAAMKRPAAAALKRPASAPPKKARVATEIPPEFKGMNAYIVNLERRPDRWERVSKMLKKETPWMKFEQHKASDGTKNPIPEEEISVVWNTSNNAKFADFYEWVFDAPGTDQDGKVWKWAADTTDEDEQEGYRFKEAGEEEWSYTVHAPSFDSSPTRTGIVEKIATGDTLKVKLVFAKRYMEPGEEQRMSGGERGCAHSHLRLWRIAAERSDPTLVLEDDVHLLFDRTDESLKPARMNGKVFTERLRLALKHAPIDYDVIYLGWSGWRGGNFKFMNEEEDPERKKYIRKAEYVWTTVAYVITQAGAKKLLHASKSGVNQPVDNFMAWEASQGRLNSFVAVDAGDTDGTWAGGIVDQFDFQGDSDIQKSDGGHQGDDAKEFAAADTGA